MLKLQSVEYEKILSGNLEALKQRDPDLYRTMLQCQESARSEIYRFDPAEILPNLLVDHKEGRILYYGNDDPLTYCRDYIASLDLKYAPLLVSFGFGLGLQLITILDEYSKKLDIRHMMIVEKDPCLFKQALMTLDLREIIGHPKIHFFVGIEADRLHEAFYHRFITNPEMMEYASSLKILTMPAAVEIDRSYYLQASTSLQKSIVHLLNNLGNEPYDSVTGIEGLLSNLRAIIESPGIKAFEKAFAGQPAIIIGAGPSLKKNMHLLLEGSRKALLVAVDAALGPLLQSGIRPHIVTTIERYDCTLDFYSELPELDDIFFLFCSLIHKDTYKAFRGPKIIAHRHREHEEWLGLAKGTLESGPLVGNFAFDIARYLGCDPIIMVGQDLSFEPEGHTHIFGDMSSYRSNMIPIEGNYRNDLMTNRYFEHSLKALQVQISFFDGLCINATEGGARIGGARLMTLKDALAQYCGQLFDCVPILKEIWLHQKMTRRDISIEIERILEVIASTLKDIDRIVGLCRQGLDAMATFENHHTFLIDKRPNAAIFKPLEAIETSLNGIRREILISPAMAVLGHIIQAYLTHFEMKRNFLFDCFHHPEFSKLKAFLLLREWFSIVGQLTLSTKHAIQGALKDMDAD
ncbi:MAG: motility associated factor glycosyltransferase family protein [Deltaproteobacteria bacterium]|nr:motility associated factor glycosyltransferase family protein [Deltaproteobacteria bacterium]